MAGVEFAGLIPTLIVSRVIVDQIFCACGYVFKNLIYII